MDRWNPSGRVTVTADPSGDACTVETAPVGSVTLEVTWPYSVLTS